MHIEVVRMTTVTLNFVQYNQKSSVTTKLPVIMLCTEKGFMVQAQYCSEWSELWVARLFDSFVPSWSMIEGTTSITFLVFYIIVSGIFNVIFSWKPHKNLLISSRDTSSWRLCKTIENKGNFSFCLIVSQKISICEFWLILLDHITYEVLDIWISRNFKFARYNFLNFSCHYPDFVHTQVGCKPSIDKIQVF